MNACPDRTDVRTGSLSEKVMHDLGGRQVHLGEEGSLPCSGCMETGVTRRSGDYATSMISSGGHVSSAEKDHVEKFSADSLTIASTHS
jgi:hypothetical protein